MRIQEGHIVRDATPEEEAAAILVETEIPADEALDIILGGANE